MTPYVGFEGVTPTGENSPAGGEKANRKERMVEHVKHAGYLFKEASYLLVPLRKLSGGLPLSSCSQAQISLKQISNI